MLLADAMEECASLADLRASRYSRLLRKPIVREFLSKRGNSHCLKKRDLESVWQEPCLIYRTSQGQWPAHQEKWDRGWHQMARPGFNLVLQLNLPMSHNREMERLLGTGRHDLQCGIHPVASGKDFTLAWSRVDLDFGTREALIEEIQSDWVRDVRDYGSSRDSQKASNYRRYIDKLLQPHLKVWAEAMLAVTIHCLRTELGINRIFYYDYETGNRMKRLESDFAPPRSLYTDLPRKFCFQRTHNPPCFLRESRFSRTFRRSLQDIHTTWFVL